MYINVYLCIFTLTGNGVIEFAEYCFLLMCIHTQQPNLAISDAWTERKGGRGRSSSSLQSDAEDTEANTKAKALSPISVFSSPLKSIPQLQEELLQATIARWKHKSPSSSTPFTPAKHSPSTPWRNQGKRRGNSSNSNNKQAQQKISTRERGFVKESVWSEVSKQNDAALIIEDLEDNDFSTKSAKSGKMSSTSNPDPNILTDPMTDPRSIILERLKRDPLSVMQAFYSIYNPDKVTYLMLSLFYLVYCVYLSSYSYSFSFSFSFLF